jgi:hypothetical protein
MRSRSCRASALRQLGNDNPGSKRFTPNNTTNFIHAVLSNGSVVRLAGASANNQLPLACLRHSSVKIEGDARFRNPVTSFPNRSTSITEQAIGRSRERNRELVLVFCSHSLLHEGFHYAHTLRIPFANAERHRIPQAETQRRKANAAGFADVWTSPHAT